MPNVRLGGINFVSHFDATMSPACDLTHGTPVLSTNKTTVPGLTVEWTGLYLLTGEMSKPKIILHAVFCSLRYIPIIYIQ